jgi:drug/metabolite transporter (DMT)-like permease
MENKAIRRAILPIVWTFGIFSVLILVFRPLPEAWKTDYRVLLGGNGLLFLVTGLSIYLYFKGLRNSNPHFFVRMMYGSLLIKMLVCLVAVLIYAMLAGKGVNRNGIIGCFILYLLYTYLEVRILRKNV